MGHYTKLATVALRLAGVYMIASGAPMFVYALVGHYLFRPMDRVPSVAAISALLYAGAGAALYALSDRIAREIGRALDQHSIQDSDLNAR